MTDGSSRPLAFILLAALLSGTLAWTASLKTSATFDEIVLVAGGVRGLAEGRWEMITDQPPLPMYFYGAAARGAALHRPPEDRAWEFRDRWTYARLLFFGLGNDHRRMLARARGVAAGVAGLTVLAAGLLAWWAAGPWAGVVAAGATAFLPDVVAHGGVAYNDLPLALTFLLALWAFDAAVRRPGPARGALAGAALAAALATKMSALALAPACALILAVETVRRWLKREGGGRELAITLGVMAAALYVALVVLYRGDASLTLLRFNFWRTVLHAGGGHEAPAYLFGRLSPDGFWYFFPVVFFLKTPVAFQVLALGGLGLLGTVARRVLTGGADARSGRAAWTRALGWRGRAPLLGVLVFGAFLLRSELNVGFRYALPVLPLLAVLASMGWAVRVQWESRRGRSPRGARALVAALLGAQALTVASFHPHYLAFSSVWVGGRDRAHLAMVDSNIDWGQGLLELRRFMEEEGVRSVRLSYFGSAPPEAYGIEYVALPSFFRLPVARTPGAEERPRFTVISVTNLHGIYLQGRDPFAPYRAREPVRVLGHVMMVYED